DPGMARREGRRGSRGDRRGTRGPLGRPRHGDHDRDRRDVRPCHVNACPRAGEFRLASSRAIFGDWSNWEGRMADPSWSKHVADVLRRNDIHLFATVPDYIVSQTLEHLWADPACTVVTATREEEALGILSGAWLGGRRGALLMQNSGLGNCINTLGSLN